MKILLDECMPRALKRELLGHECRTVPEAGLAGKKNGELFNLAEAAGFEVLLTVDKGLEYEQNLANRKIALLVVSSRSNDIDNILPHVPAVLNALGSIKAGKL